MLSHMAEKSEDSPAFLSGSIIGISIRNRISNRQESNLTFSVQLYSIRFRNTLHRLAYNWKVEWNSFDGPWLDLLAGVTNEKSNSKRIVWVDAKPKAVGLQVETVINVKLFHRIAIIILVERSNNWCSEDKVVSETVSINGCKKSIFIFNVIFGDIDQLVGCQSLGCWCRSKKGPSDVER